MNAPNGWNKITLGELISLQRGYDLPKQNRKKGDVPVVGGGGYNGYHSEIKAAGPGVVLGRSGAGFGSAFFVKEDFWPHNTGLFVTDFRGNDRLYVFHFLNWFDFRSYNSGGAQPSLNRNFIYPITLAYPPLTEQKAIADLLSTWDEAIEKTELLIQAKKKQLKQLSRSLLFGRKRLKNQKNDLDDGRFFKYPSDWGLATIGEVAKEISVRNGESEETVLSCSKYDGFVNSLDYFGKQVFSSDTSNYKVVKKGQFGYPSNHVEEGSIGLLEHCEKGIVSPIYVVFEAAKEKVHPAYLYKLLKTDIYRHIFQVSTSSSVDRRGSLRWGDFSKIKVLLPSLEEQQQIADTLSTAQQEIDLLKQLAEKYKTQKRGLMQKMLTGEWRIKPEIVDQYVEKDHE
ncbi:MAG: restriction endonuclease subunit S [Candidatus Electrothrix sp. AX5]|nr:restriction endonuclease subunit S [Candidatus Electrothrix sp. AX5]